MKKKKKKIKISKKLKEIFEKAILEEEYHKNPLKYLEKELSGKDDK